MIIQGPKKLVKRAKFVANLMKLEGFVLKISWTNNGSYCQQLSDGRFKIKIGRHHASIIDVIAHEMVHLAQYHKGRLLDLENGIVLWEGKRYLDPEYLSKAYWLVPWEMEARGYEAYAGWCWRHR